MQRLNLGRFLIGKHLETKRTSSSVHQQAYRVSRVLVGCPVIQRLRHPQEMLIILAMAGGGAAVLGISIPLAIAISVLLTIVTISYRQTIHAYPKRCSAYISF
ncbi:MAG: hypothetical protein H6671_04110 [Anaerolineaceae bacterium]|nr:hypothetical protein [Anaerolineaceae bacterium]